MTATIDNTVRSTIFWRNVRFGIPGQISNQRERSKGWLQVVNWNIGRMKLILTDMSHKLAIYFFTTCILLGHNLTVAQLWHFRVYFYFSPIINKSVVSVLGHRYLSMYLWFLWYIQLTFKALDTYCKHNQYVIYFHLSLYC